jgi:DNA topoisomerase I
VSNRGNLLETRVAAKAAGLHYVTAGEPGFVRVKHGKSFLYRDQRGRSVRDPRTLDRIKSIVIPPAWTDVWICIRADGHLQATGRDARGRKQHRYHASWTAARNESKFEGMIAFAQALPAIRRRVQTDLRQPTLTQRRILATVVALLEKTLIRIGNEEYARDNNSYGLTTMRDEHVQVNGTAMTFRFRAKSGITQTIELKDTTLARIVKQCRALPGRALFQYVDAAGTHQCVDSAAVNQYLRQITGQVFTAKTFRTWAATVLAAKAMGTLPESTSDAAFKRNIVGAIDSVAGRLGNTRAVCRKSYIHPGVFESYRRGVTIGASKPGPRIAGLSADEAAVVALLKRLRRHAPAQRQAA